MWKQLRSADIGITYTGGMCLDAIRRAYGIAAKYGRAIDDWNSGNKHTEAIPAGLTVPIYFSLGNVPAGHIAIQLPDGRVASSTQGGTHQGLYIHPNRDDLIRIYSDPKYGNGKCTYLGWSEEVNDIAVVTQQGGSTMLDELTIKRAVEGAYLESTGNLPAPNIIQQKADYIQKAGGFNQVLKDIFSLGVNYVPKSQAGGGGSIPADVQDNANRYLDIRKALKI